MDKVISYELEQIIERLQYPLSQLNMLLADSERDYWEGYVDAICDLFPEAYDIIESQKGIKDT